MGNRAVITIAPYAPENIGIYVHWNGGRESIEGFLAAARELEYRTPGADPAYALARLTQAIGCYFGGTTSLGIGRCSDLDTNNGDNGVWEIGPEWAIVNRSESYAADHAQAICDATVRKVRLAEMAAAR